MTFGSVPWWSKESSTERRFFGLEQRGIRFRHWKVLIDICPKALQWGSLFNNRLIAFSGQIYQWSFHYLKYLPASENSDAAMTLAFLLSNNRKICIKPTPDSAYRLIHFPITFWYVYLSADKSSEIAVKFVFVDWANTFAFVQRCWQRQAHNFPIQPNRTNKNQFQQPC